MITQASYPRTTFWLWPTILASGIIAVLLHPDGFVATARQVLHGLCAQTPSHSFVIGGHILPFDARMTGIYSGSLAGLVVLSLRRRLLAQNRLPWPVLGVLAIMVGSMALDGTNSLLTDVGVWHPWTTTNATRLITGYLAGIALAVALVWLIAGTVWHLADKRAAVESPSGLLTMLLPLPLIWVLVSNAPGWLYVPVSLALMVSAWIVVAMISTSAVLLITHWDDRVSTFGDLHIPGAVGLAIGLAIMLALAFGRAWLESTLGIPSTL